MKRENRRAQKKEMNGVEPEGTDLSIQKRIALRAYELYVQRGGLEGYAERDWLQAERDILQEERH